MIPSAELGYPSRVRAFSLVASLGLLAAGCPAAPGESAARATPVETAVETPPSTTSPETDAASKSPGTEPAPTRARVNRVGPLRLPEAFPPSSELLAHFAFADLRTLRQGLAADPQLARLGEAAWSKLAARLDPELARLIERLHPSTPAGCLLLRAETDAPSPLPVVCLFRVADESAKAKVWGEYTRSDLAKPTDVTLGGERWQLALATSPPSREVKEIWFTLSRGPVPNSATRKQLYARVVDRPGPLGARFELVASGPEGLRSTLSALGGLELPAAVWDALAGELQETQMHLGLEATRPVLDLAFRFTPGAQIDASYRASALHSVDPEALRGVPPRSAAFVTGAVELARWGGHWLGDPLVGAALEGWATQAQLERASLHARLEALLALASEGYAPGSTWSLDRRADGELSVSWVRRLEGASTKAKWRAFAESLAPADYLGRFGQDLDAKFTAAADAGAGVEVDRLELRVREDRREAWRRGAPWQRAWAEAGVLRIERFEVGREVVVGFDTRPRTDTNERWVAWLQKPVAQRSSVHMGSFARAPAGLPWIGGVDTTQLRRGLEGQLGEGALVLHGGLDDLRITMGRVAPSDLLVRLEGSDAWVDAFGPELAGDPPRVPTRRPTQAQP